MLGRLCCCCRGEGCLHNSSHKHSSSSHKHNSCIMGDKCSTHKSDMRRCQAEVTYAAVICTACLAQTQPWVRQHAQHMHRRNHVQSSMLGTSTDATMCKAACLAQAQTQPCARQHARHMHMLNSCTSTAQPCKSPWHPSSPSLRATVVPDGTPIQAALTHSRALLTSFPVLPLLLPQRLACCCCSTLVFAVQHLLSKGLQYNHNTHPTPTHLPPSQLPCSLTSHLGTVCPFPLLQLRPGCCWSYLVHAVIGSHSHHPSNLLCLLPRPLLTPPRPTSHRPTCTDHLLATLAQCAPSLAAAAAWLLLVLLPCRCCPALAK
jgi:hypothetical protein